MKVYRFDRIGLLIVGTVLFSIVPLSSVWEMLQNGTIDWNRMSTGRLLFPYWLLLSLAWPIFFCFVFLFLLPALRSIIRGYEFKIDGDVLIVGQTIIHRDEIREFGYKFGRGLEIRTNAREFYFYPGFNQIGERDFNNFINNK